MTPLTPHKKGKPLGLILGHWKLKQKEGSAWVRTRHLQLGVRVNWHANHSATGAKATAVLFLRSEFKCCKRQKCSFLALLAVFLNQSSSNLVQRWLLAGRWFSKNCAHLWSRDHRKWAWQTPKMQLSKATSNLGIFFLSDEKS